MALAQTPDATAPTPPAPKAKAGTYARVQQILDQNCIGCHSGERAREGINLTSYDNILKGGREGKIVTPKDLKKSVLAQVLRGTPGYKQMPPRQAPLAEEDIKSIETWISKGAKKK